MGITHKGNAYNYVLNNYQGGIIMNAYQTDLENIAKIKTKDQWSYTIGYINAEYAYNIITSEQYDTLFELLTLKKERLV